MALLQLPVKQMLTETWGGIFNEYIIFSQWKDINSSSVTVVVGLSVKDLKL